MSSFERMSAETLNRRFRFFSLALAGFIFAGTIVELIFAQHMEVPLQWIPFILSGLGLATVVIVFRAPRPNTIRAMQAVMAVIILGSALGVFLHIKNNLDFALEIRPNALANEVFLEALSGASPLLAPGILALGAILALAATYYHPALRPTRKHEAERAVDGRQHR